MLVSKVAGASTLPSERGINKFFIEP